MQRVPEGRTDDRARLEEMAGLRGSLADSLAALEAEVERLRGVVETAAEPPAPAEPPAGLFDWDLPPLDPAWTAELDALLAPGPRPATVPAPLDDDLDALLAPRPVERDGLAAPRRRRVTLPAVLATVGALAVADCVVTLVWEEPLTSIYGAWQQGRLDDRLERVEREVAADLAAPEPAQGATGTVRERELARMARAASRLAARSRAGDPLGRVRIPRMGTDVVLVEGTGGAALRSGPGRYGHTGMPGQPGATFGVAGHRTSWSAPFRRIDRLERGDRIAVTMPYGRFTYAVTTKRIVRPDDVWVLQDRTRSRIVLTACHPLFSAAKRIVVTAELVRSTARGAARV